MGKRKSARKQVVKVRERLTTTFTCFFCNHEKAVECKLNREHGIGSLSCRSCGQQWQTTIHALSESIDVYSDWVDACHAKQKQSMAAAAASASTDAPKHSAGASSYAPLGHSTSNRGRERDGDESPPPPPTRMIKGNKKPGSKNKYDEISSDENTEDEDAADVENDEDRGFIVPDDSDVEAAVGAADEKSEEETELSDDADSDNDQEQSMKGMQAQAPKKRKLLSTSATLIAPDLQDHEEEEEARNVAIESARVASTAALQVQSDDDEE